LLTAGRSVSKAQILDHVWRYDFGGDSSVVETYISYLRKKIDQPGEPRLIQTVRGFGYALQLRTGGRALAPAHDAAAAAVDAGGGAGRGRFAGGGDRHPLRASRLPDRPGATPAAHGS